MEKKILIIGAGASGIAAATKLLSNGFQNVIILEAENRIGGRINTITFADNVLDMGAQWCYGQEGNVVYEMAKDKNVLELSEHDLIFQFIQSNGEVVPKDVADKLMKVGMSILEEDSYVQEQTSYTGSLGNFFSEKYHQLLEGTEFNDIDSEMKQKFFECFHNMTNSLQASDSWYELSTNPHEYEDADGDLYVIWKRGYATVFDLLQNKIGDHPEGVVDVAPRIRFNKTATKIVYNQPMLGNDDAKVRVDCSDGSSFNADHLICTISLAVLKEQHLSLFEPLLPQYKFDSIEGMMMGTVDKIYLEFEKPFWNDDASFCCFLWKLEQIKEAREDPANGKWLDGITLFNTVRHQPNILCFWIPGAKAREMEASSDADVKAGAEKLLRMFMKGVDIPNATAMLRSTWYSNPHFRGSYSYYSLKSDALGASCDKLAEPINDSKGKPIIQFAGEATFGKRLGNVHAAVESGWREAERLINLYKMANQ